jgi:hypothetical protein
VNEIEDNLDMRVFQSGDFDAYLQNKWNSNMFTLERRRVKEKLARLGAVLAEGIEASGLKLVRHSSDEFPSFWNKKQVDRQWLFFSRDEVARTELTDIIDKKRTLADTLADPTPMYRHIFLGVSVSEDSLDMGIWMHHDAWVDRRNFVNLCGDETACGELLQMLRELPDHFELGIDTGDIASPSSFGTEEIASLSKSFDEDKAWMFLGARLPRDQVIVLGEDIFNAAAEIFETLVPVYRRIAWSPANDLISIESILAERNEDLKHSREELERERSEREARLREQKAAGAAMKEEIAERIRETAAWRSREIAVKRAHAAKAAAAAKEEDARARAEAMAAQWGLGGKKDAPVQTENAVTPKPAPAAKAEPSGGERSEDTSRRGKGGDKRFRSDKPRFQMPSRDKGKKISPNSYLVDHPRASAPATLGEFKVKDRIEVVRGFLKGRRGVIQEIDEKGWVKVGFGIVSSRLAPEDLRCLGSDGAHGARVSR